MKKYMSAIALVFISLLISCSESTDFTTKVISRQEVASTPGFTWFELKVQMYQPNTLIIDEIKNNLKSEHNFYFFAAPACSCDSLQNLFPDAVKVLDEAGLNSENTKFIAMKDAHADNPFSDLFQVNDLPEVYLVIGGRQVFSVADSLRYRNSIAASNPSMKKYSIEEIVLEAVQKVY